MADPIDDLEAMIAEALDAADAGARLKIHNSVTNWRLMYGGVPVFVQKRSAQIKRERALSLLNDGLPTKEVSKRIGASVRQVQRIKKSSAVI